MDITFNKISNMKYLVKEPEEAIAEVNRLLTELTCGSVDDFEENINNYLFDTMLSRLLVSHFLLKHPTAVAELNFVSIDIKLPTRTLTITAGVNSMGKDIVKKFNGVLYA